MIEEQPIDFYVIETAQGKREIPAEQVAGMCFPPTPNLEFECFGNEQRAILQPALFSDAARVVLVDGTVVWSIGDQDWHKNCKHCKGKG